MLYECVLGMLLDTKHLDTDSILMERKTIWFNTEYVYIQLWMFLCKCIHLKKVFFVLLLGPSSSKFILLPFLKGNLLCQGSWTNGQRKKQRLNEEDNEYASLSLQFYT